MNTIFQDIKNIKNSPAKRLQKNEEEGKRWYSVASPFVLLSKSILDKLNLMYPNDSA